MRFGASTSPKYHSRTPDPENKSRRSMAETTQSLSQWTPSSWLTCQSGPVHVSLMGRKRLFKTLRRERLYLYLAAIPAAISSVFLREEGGQIPKFQNEQLLGEYLDFLDEERERAQLRTAYQQRLVFTTPRRTSAIGDPVLRKVEATGRDPGKLGANWEGPYRKDSSFGSYKLESLGATLSPRVWNSDKPKEILPVSLCCKLIHYVIITSYRL
ncbi:UNVERIFIED_CONTAM: hypothetical protein Sangu_3173100 [Sesamum angustifolium]|uniref:Uncharacterized protein n=1 Tax=Sesamum angustifolium TaxID=2727405 RepID=A0AAW2JTG9_9LAMI